jgi:uncharacterized protein DUF5672
VSGDLGRAAIVVPFYRPELTPDEALSLRHLEHFLAEHDRYLLMPESLSGGLHGFRVKRLSDRWFESRRTYSELLLSREFYRAFSDHEYVLVYQLDCLVFKDELVHWCDKGHDYIGAVHRIPTHPPAVGNGGFSLRRVAGFLEVLESKTRTVDPHDYWVSTWAHRPPLERWLNKPRVWVKHLRHFNGVRWEIRRTNRADYGWPEDWFWSLEASKYSSRFRVAPNEDGLRFAFDESPSEYYEALGRQLPFGCHGWTGKREFWETFLLPG